jgi:hypothetical protein
MIYGHPYHLGVVVADLDRAMERYANVFGVARFARIDVEYPARYRDWRGMIANRNAFCPWGRTYLELVEPVRGEGPQREWLRERGEGVFHVGYAAADEGAQRPADIEPCYDVLNLHRPDGTPRVVFLDTASMLGYYIELVDRSIADLSVRWIDDVSAGRRSDALRI